MAFKGFVEDLPEREQKLAFFNKLVVNFDSKVDGKVVRAKVIVDGKDWFEGEKDGKLYWNTLFRTNGKTYSISGLIEGDNICLAKGMSVDVIEDGNVVEHISFVRISSIDGILWNKIK